jgi:hypothetical protein
MKRHLHLMGLIKSPLFRKSEAEEETSAHILRDCEVLASLRHAYLGSIFLDPEDIKFCGPSGTLVRNRAPLNWNQIMPQKDPFIRPRCIGTARARTFN